VERFHDALMDATSDEQAILATEHLEPVMATLVTWRKPTTPMADVEPAEDPRTAAETTDAIRTMGSIMALTALLIGPDNEMALAYAAGAVAVYAGQASGFGWVTGYHTRDKN
jgi:hypothetical protein